MGKQQSYCEETWEVPQDRRAGVMASSNASTVRFGSEGEFRTKESLFLKDGRGAAIPCQKTFALNLAFIFSDETS